MWRRPSAWPTDIRRAATRGLRAILASYVLFGAGYIAYTTFVVAYLRTRLGFSAGDVTLFWGCVGIAATGAGLAWGPLLARLSGGRGVAVANAVVTLGAILPVLSATRPAVYASAVLFGGAFLIVPTAGDDIRAQGGTAAGLDGGHRHADGRLRHRPVHRAVAQRYRVGCRLWRRGRASAVGRDPRLRRADCAGATRATASVTGEEFTREPPRTSSTAPTTAPLWSAISICPRDQARTRPFSRCTAADGSYPAATSTGSWDISRGTRLRGLQHRLSAARDGENHYPAAVHDVRAAVQWVRSHAAE